MPRPTAVALPTRGNAPPRFLVPIPARIHEVREKDPAGARLGAILQVLLAREPAHAMPLIRAWWPPAFPVPPQLALSDRGPSRDLFMVRPLADVAMPERVEDLLYWRSDYF